MKNPGDVCADPVRPNLNTNSSCVSFGRPAARTEAIGYKGLRGAILGNEVGPADYVETSEEVQPVDTLPSPYMPTQSERDDHELTHAQYRSWCEFCVNGRGLEMGHRQGDDHGERGVAVIGFDYMFLTGKDTYTRGEWAECDERDLDPMEVLKVLVVRDMRSKSIFGHAVKCKGSDESGYAVRCLVEDVKWLGYSRIILKSDNEPAIVKLLADTLKSLRIDGVVEQALEEHPPPYDPQSNGGIETGVKLIKGHLRTHRSALEARVGYKVPVAHPLMSWLVSHVANILTWYSVGRDGRTAYHRVRGRPFNGKLLLFGEYCRYKARSHEPLHGRNPWAGAIYLGRENVSGQHILYDDEAKSVAYARTLMRVPNQEKWKLETLAAVRITPWSLHEASKPTVVFRDQVEQRERVDVEPKARRVYLKPADFENFGFTSGCPRCEFDMKHGTGRTSKPHSEGCRNRVEAELAKTPAGQRRLAEASARLDRATAEVGEQYREDVSQRPVAQGENVEIGPSASNGPAMRAQVGGDESSNPFRLSGDANPKPVVEPVEPIDVEPEIVEQANGEVVDGGMDLGVVAKEKPLGRGARVIAREVVTSSTFDCQGASGGGDVDTGCQIGTDREGQRRKLIMEVGPIGELVASGGDGPRTLLPLCSKAATAHETPVSFSAPVHVVDSSPPRVGSEVSSVMDDALNLT